MGVLSPPLRLGRGRLGLPHVNADGQSELREQGRGRDAFVAERRGGPAEGVCGVGSRGRAAREGGSVRVRRREGVQTFLRRWGRSQQTNGNAGDRTGEEGEVRKDGPVGRARVSRGAARQSACG